MLTVYRAGKLECARFLQQFRDFHVDLTRYHEMNILRSIVAGPRARHPEAGLDLCYVTENMIATSGPSATYPQLAYRNPLDELVRFLDSKHGKDWAIWEFRAEGTGYPDAEVYNRIHHFPWPDHHPPPFALIPSMMASMRNWLHGLDTPDCAAHPDTLVTKDGVKSNGKRVIVVHCKAGKGRSGTATVSYLMSEEGWAKDVALQRFTERRMRPGFGAGISIPSQRRYIDYVEQWTQHNKFYLDRPIEVLEVHVWGLRDGCKVAVEGFIDEGKTIKTMHVFTSAEREDVGPMNTMAERLRTFVAPSRSQTPSANPSTDDLSKAPSSTSTTSATTSASQSSADPSPNPPSTNAIFRPTPGTRITTPTSDINLAIERRSRAGYGWTMVTSVAHVWFNCFFEGNGALNQPTDARAPPARPDPSGVFSIAWDAMDGIKGSSRKGVRAFDKVAVVWRAVPGGPGGEVAVVEPGPGETVRETRPVDEQGQDRDARDEGTAKYGPGGMAQDLGLREERPDSAGVSRASSVRSAEAMAVPDNRGVVEGEGDDDDGFRGVETGLKLPENE